MKKLALAASLAAFLVSPLSTHAQVTKPPIPNVAGATTSAQFGSIITNPFGSPSTGDRVLFATPANNGILVTNGTGVPSISSTLPAHTLGGTVSGGGNQLNNVVIGTTTPLAGSFTTVSARVGTDENLHIRDNAGTTQIRAMNNASSAFVNLLVDAAIINFNSISGGTEVHTGATSFLSTTSFSNPITYGGVALSNSVTGTGSMVLSVSPTVSGTFGFASGSLAASSAFFGGATNPGIGNFNLAVNAPTAANTSAMVLKSGDGTRAYWYGNNGSSFLSTVGAIPLILGTNDIAAITIDGTSGIATHAAPIVTPGYAVASLPVAPGTGARAHVTDQLTACPVLGGTFTGGGVVVCSAFYTGAAWTHQ